MADLMLGQALEGAESALGRELSYDEIRLVTRMHSAGKGLDYMVEVLLEETPPEPSDDELVTTRYEAAGRTAVEIP